MSKETKEEVYNELIRIAGENDGQLAPPVVVERARNPASPLHNYFEWDDGEAAEQYRLWQARKLIKVCVMVLPGTTEQHQVFVSLKEDRNKEGGYRMLVDVMSDSELRNKLLLQAKQDFDYWRAKYHHLEELVPVFKAMEQIH